MHHRFRLILNFSCYEKKGLLWTLDIMGAAMNHHFTKTQIKTKEKDVRSPKHCAFVKNAMFLFAFFQNAIVLLPFTKINDFLTDINY